MFPFASVKYLVGGLIGILVVVLTSLWYVLPVFLAIFGYGVWLKYCALHTPFEKTGLQRYAGEVMGMIERLMGLRRVLKQRYIVQYASINGVVIKRGLNEKVDCIGILGVAQVMAGGHVKKGIYRVPVKGGRYAVPLDMLNLSVGRYVFMLFRGKVSKENLLDVFEVEVV